MNYDRNNKVKVYWNSLDTKDISEEELKRFETFVSDEKLEKSRRMLQSNDRKCCVMGEILLKYILQKHYNLSLEQVSFRYNELGKPF